MMLKAMANVIKISCKAMDFNRGNNYTSRHYYVVSVLSDLKVFAHWIDRLPFILTKKVYTNHIAL